MRICFTSFVCHAAEASLCSGAPFRVGHPSYTKGPKVLGGAAPYRQTTLLTRDTTGVRGVAYPGRRAMLFWKHRRKTLHHAGKKTG